MAFFGGPIPTIPDSMNRPLGTLLEEGIMWTLSRRERDRLHKHWLTEIRERLHEDQLQDFQSLRDKHASVLQKHQEGKDEVGCFIVQLTSRPHQNGRLVGSSLITLTSLDVQQQVNEM
jgi:hypothetical protein